MKAQEPRQTMRATVKAAASSKVKGDGRGMRSLTTTPRAPGLGVTTNAGRHATGERLANPGTHGKQGAHASGMNPGTGYNPKTGVSPVFAFTLYAASASSVIRPGKNERNRSADDHSPAGPV